MTRTLRSLIAGSLLFGALALSSPAGATPVCTDGYMGGLPRAACGNRVFPEAANSVDYVQYLPDATGFREAEHGLRYLAQLYPRYVSVFTLRQLYNTDLAVSAGRDQRRSTDPADSKDGYDIFVVKLTDHQVPDEGKQTLLFSLSVHGDEKGGIEGGFRAIEDLAMAASSGGSITDGVQGYESTTGEDPKFHSYAVSEVLKKEAVYFVDFNIDGWVRGDR
ncbi:MAG TPA: hypothetical protein VEA19_02800, partial [Actinomycetota bacterium]|nr:hypothetical protein [Actinomycetota bacterium]